MKTWTWTFRRVLIGAPLVGALSLLLIAGCSSEPANPGGGSGAQGNLGTGGLNGTGANAPYGTGGAGPGAGGGGGAIGTGGNNPQGTGGQNPGAGGSMLGSDEEYPVPTDLEDEDGSLLWLRYPQVPIPGRLAEYQAAFTHVVNSGASASLTAAEEELVLGLSGLTGMSITSETAPTGAGAVVVGTPTSSTVIADANLAQLGSVGDEGYVVTTLTDGTTVIAGNSDIGALYGAFAFLRHLQSHSSIEDLELVSSPQVQIRMLNHWDNLDRTVERGYSGQSIWEWNALPGTMSPRYKAYARANASVGINGASLTNVNADAEILTASYIAKVKALADLFRGYGIRVYLTARFSAPIEIGGLGTADPLDSGVRTWWANKADELYAAIPDFGGFLVKANSEGQPGPQDYNRNHAEGANMLAEAVGDRGVVIWRAFVYGENLASDRIRQAYDQFQPLDGDFADNVLIQSKNGPLDFQPREPFAPLFGAMPNTPLALELQITKEYLGQDTHLAYVGPWYEEVLKTDTYAGGQGSTVARIIDGTTHDYSVTAMAGVSNVGTDANWTGSQFNQANWYAYGRMAWNPDASAQAVAEEWVRQTFSNDPVVVNPVVKMMMDSHEHLVNYMTPLGLVHIMATGHHYGPGPWINNLSRAEWNPFYYHEAANDGIGFDRTASGSNAIAQYSSQVQQIYGDVNAVPEKYLLFFHRVPWTRPMASGRTLWEEMVHLYSSGVDGVADLRGLWTEVEMRIDDGRYAEVTDFLRIQHEEARWWRDACLSYFSSVGGGAIPSGYAAPLQSLANYQSYESSGSTCGTGDTVGKSRCPEIATPNPSPAILP